MVPVFTLLVLLGTFVIITKQTNWAQSSGELQQNVVISAIPSPYKKHFQPRYGHAVVVVPRAVTSGVISEGDIFLLGGDTYTGTTGWENLKAGLGDIVWNNGYKNDVWKTEGTEWLVHGDHRYRNKYHEKIPKVESKLKWTQVIVGYHPSPGMTYEDFIICEKYFASQTKYATQRSKLCPSNGETIANILWSPRRHHAAVYMNEYIYVMGGRAREFVDYKRDRSIGGVEGPHVQGVPNIPDNRLIKVREAREAAVYKNDVWRSKNGLDWQLVTPGCRAPQELLLAEGNARSGKIGEEAYQCVSDDNCWGAEKCDITRKVCYCPMWSAREQMAVAVYSNTMYLSGGYASRLFSAQTNCGRFACGDTDAGSYRYYMPDVWSSTDGEQWNLITSLFPGGGRGGHQMLVVPNPATGLDYLWVVGGRTGDNNGVSTELTYFNDIVVAQLPGASNWYDHTDSRSDLAYYGGEDMPWSGRVGHTVTMEPAAPVNLYTRAIYIVGGYTRTIDKEGKPIGEFLDEVWSLRPDVPGDFWRRDFEGEAVYFTGERETLRSGNHSPSIYYLTPDHNITYLRRMYVPNRFGKGDAEIASGKPYEVRPYLTDEKVRAMMSVGVNTIRDLATADQTTILKLRGIDTPDVALEDRLSVLDVCDFRALAIAVVSKCTVTIPKTLWDGELQRPYNQEPYAMDQYNTHIQWHKIGNQLPPVYDDVETLQTTWDGCTYNEIIQGIHGPTIEGIGYVEQVMEIRDPLPELQELHCRWTPGPRAYHAALYFDEKLHIFGGKASEESFRGDTWYRDNKMPLARFDSKPSPYTDNPIFRFTCNEPGCIFEYRVWDPYNYIELREWTQVVQKADVKWLDWRMNGPGDGLYMVFVRAVDAAGNRDERYFYKLNVHEWYYLSPTPWDIIAEAVGTFIGLGLFGYLEYRRRVRRAAMERYAMKRMRRKFKAMQRDIDGRAIDWRSLYMESKEAELAGGNKQNDALRKKRDKKAEKREKERSKREKEKEKIKRKMKGDKGEKKEKKEKTDVESEKIDSSSAKVSLSSKSSKEKPASKGEKKYKDYEKGGGESGGSGADEPSAQAMDPNETGTKQRKQNKRYKEYEVGEGDDKKDI